MLSVKILKKYLKEKFIIFMLLPICGFLATCDMQLGLGDPVDTIAPSITILNPRDNQFMRGIAIGDPILLSGVYSDDFGVTELSVIVTNMITKEALTIKENEFTFEINNDDTWKAWLRLPGEESVADYRIRIIARDKFKNEGADEVAVRVDLVAPWVNKKEILRHSKFTSGLHEIDYYQDLNFQASGAYKKIQYANIDDFQNESFDIRLEIAFNLDKVAASRLDVYSETGIKLNDEPLIPDNEALDIENPVWRITQDNMNDWSRKIGNMFYEYNAHYIYFVAMAWNTTSWDPDGTGYNGGGTVAGELFREQKIGGTCWYPESDNPYINVNADISTGFTTLYPNTAAALTLQFYDDDRISEIYAALIPREKMDALREGVSETVYLESLVTDNLKRTELINSLKLDNLYNSSNDRRQYVYLDSDIPGEYSLVAFTRDDIGAGLNTVKNQPLWTVHTPLRVIVNDPDDPLIIVEDPSMENIFPALTDGRKFSISGYSIDNTGIDTIQIAWIPVGTPHSLSNLTQADAQAALRESVSNQSYNQTLANQGSVIINGIKIWRLAKGARSSMSLNDVDYVRDNYSQVFDILDDFKYSGNTENDNKHFVIHAVKGTKNIFKSFRLTGYTTKPVIEVIYPFRDMLVHDKEQDLVLKMKINSSIGIKPESIKIIDISTGNNNQNRYLTNLVLINGEYQRTLSSQNIKTYFADDSRITYSLSAEDILGNSQQIERTVIISSLPSLNYITSSNAKGVYGVGENLRFEAVFSLPVRVIALHGTYPRLKLYFENPKADGFIETPTNHVYADYVAVAGNTIVFDYKIKEGDVSPKLHNCDEPIILNNASIQTTEPNGGDAIISLIPGNGVQYRVEIGVDGIYPVVKGAGFTQPGSGHHYYNNGKTVTLELYTSKKMRVSGTPTASIRYESSEGGGTVKASFSKIEHSSTGSTLFFTYDVELNNNIPKSQLRWASPWMEYSGTDSITDDAGNALDIRPAAINMLDNPYDLNGVRNENKIAFIVTRPPAAPTFALYSDSNLSHQIPVTSSRARTNSNVYIKLIGAEETVLYYSLEAGNNPNPLSGNYAMITEMDDPNKNSANNNPHNSGYLPSEFKITAWQEDFAGNRSPSVDPVVDLTINSRAPELVDVTCEEPNGSYNTGKTLHIRLVFSRNVRASANGASLVLKGNDAPYNNQSPSIPLVQANNSAFSSSLVFNWLIPSGLQMKDIKVTAINLSNIVDEYGNAMPDFLIGLSSENETTRPITANLNRGPAAGNEGLVVDSTGPAIILTNPAAPSSAGEYYNGGLLAKEPEAAGSNAGKIVDGRIVLTFNKPLWANSGKYITIKPHGNWLIPPVLTLAEMDELYNYQFVEANGDIITNQTTITNFKRRLQFIDANGLPDLVTRTQAGITTAFGQRTELNSYIHTTHGLVSGTGGFVRPDTSGKWVLAFDRNLDNASLREVFNAAMWKWQKISVTSGSVVISGSTVTITLPQPLDKGRIWEINIDAGAFRDAAGNESTAVSTSTTNYNNAAGYRFWSKGTENPVIRVDRYSHGENFHGHPQSFRGDWNTMPKIDTKVRIDCETPGAVIRYDAIRTKYTLKGGATDSSSAAFTTTTAATRDAFFNHLGAAHTINTKPTNANYNNSNEGYQNNWIGNGGSHQGMTGQVIPMSQGYFAGLLVPNADETLGTTAAVMNTNNGAVTWAQVETRGNNLRNGVNLSANGREYRNVSANGNETWGASTFAVSGNTNTTAEAANGRFFYAGDAWWTTGTALENNRDASGAADERLFTGRRDYVMAAAQKPQITSGTLSGPSLDVSNASYEGVYKTTVLMRQPSNGVYWLTLQGFDTPMAPSTPGFPLQEYIAGPPTPYNTFEYLYFSRQMWRVSPIRSGNSASAVLTYPTGASTGRFPTDVVSNTNLTATRGTGNDRTHTIANGNLGTTGEIRQVYVGTTEANSVQYYFRVFSATTFRLYNNMADAITGGNGVNPSGNGNITLFEGWRRINLMANNNHIWVSWDIVSDWYFKGRSLTNAGASGRLQRAGHNYGAVLATYGSVSYRFRQNWETAYAIIGGEAGITE